MAYSYDGFWACMDTFKEKQHLDDLHSKGCAPPGRCGASADDFARLVSGAACISCLGAHSDDIEIGCGGTILRLAQESPATEFYRAVFSGEAQRKTEAKKQRRSFPAGRAQQPRGPQ